MFDISGEYAGYTRTGIFKMPGIVYTALQYEAMHYEMMDQDERHNNRPQDLITTAPCINNVINKTHLCSFSSNILLPTVPSKHGL